MGGPGCRTDAGIVGDSSSEKIVTPFGIRECNCLSAWETAGGPGGGTAGEFGGAVGGRADAVEPCGTGDCGVANEDCAKTLGNVFAALWLA